MSLFAAEIENSCGGLALLTYADIHAVNPEALTPWKAEMLWQLLSSISAERWTATACRRQRSIFVGASAGADARREEGEIENFLEGFPRQYLAGMSRRRKLQSILGGVPKAEQGADAKRGESRAARLFVALTADQPALFATIAGVLAGWE